MVNLIWLRCFFNVKFPKLRSDSIREAISNNELQDYHEILDKPYQPCLGLAKTAKHILRKICIMMPKT